MSFSLIFWLDGTFTPVEAIVPVEECSCESPSVVLFGRVGKGCWGQQHN